jgi:hypothetical protein
MCSRIYRVLIWMVVIASLRQDQIIYWICSGAHGPLKFAHFIIPHKISCNYFEDYLMTKLTLGLRYSNQVKGAW